MAHKPKKLLWTVAGGLLTAAILGSLAASAADVNDLGAISLNRFVVTESGERVLTDSVSSDQVTQSGWYVSTDDSLYYYYADGSYATDETTLDDGNTYLFGPDGMLKTGWQTVGSKRYYYSTEVGAPEYGWVNYLDHLYYIDQENGKLTGVQEINGIPYTFDDYGCVQTGWITYDDGGTYYYDADAVPAMGWTTLDENTYYFTADGAATGIADVDGSKYSFTADGVLQTGGWITSLDGGTCYASENGALAVGMTVLDGKTYYFNENGVMQTSGSHGKCILRPDIRIHTIDQHILHAGTRQNARDAKSLLAWIRHILRTVYRQIDRTVQQGFLDFLYEHRLATKGADCRIFLLVPLRCHDHFLKLHIRVILL